MTLKKIAGIVMTLGMALSYSAPAAEKAIAMDLGKLYQSYLKSGRSADQMPEFQKRVKFSGVVVHQSTNMSGEPLVGVGTEKLPQELGRMTGDDDQEDAKLRGLSVGTKFQATCEVGFTMGSSYMSLQHCSL
jgi:hypothetical protein